MLISRKNALMVAAFIATTTTAYSQDYATIEEVVVTATKRSASVQEVPAAIDAYTPSQLADAGISNVADLSAINSGFRINDSTSATSIFIRGIGASIQGNTTDSTTAVFIDGVYQARGYALGSLGSL